MTHLVIIECDVVPDSLSHWVDEYSNMFVEAFGRLRSAWTFEVVKAHQGHLPALDPGKAYLITGSKHDAFSELDWIQALRDWVVKAYELRLSVVGICFGHQLIAHALGGKTDRAQGWGLGRMPADALIDLPFASADLLVSHQDQVLALPPKAQRLLASDFCPNYGFKVGCMIGIQGHPEFKPEYSRALAEERRERIGCSAVDSALATLDLPLNADAVIDWLATHLENRHA